MKKKLFTLIGVLVILASAINASAETPTKLNNFNIYTKYGEVIHTRATIRTYFWVIKFNWTQSHNPKLRRKICSVFAKTMTIC